MKVLLIYPPDGGIPSAPYASLPTLAPCLKEAGHEVVLRDVNLEVFYDLMNEETLLRYYDAKDKRRIELEQKLSLEPEETEELQDAHLSLCVPASALSRVAQDINVMRSSNDFYDPEKFNRALDNLFGGVRFYFGRNPLPYGVNPNLVNNLFTALKRDWVDPIGDLYDRSIVANLLEEKPDLIGISIPFMISYYQAMKLIKHIRKQAPDIPIVIGGVTIFNCLDPMATDAKLYDLFDYAIVGEGDKSICELATVLENEDNLDTVSNLYYRDSNGVVKNTTARQVDDLNALPAPEFTDMPMDQYLTPWVTASFQTSRGCYYGKCSFCSLSYRDNFRMRSPENVLEDMIKINEATGVNLFLLWDSLSPPKTLKYLAKEIKERGLDFHWFAETKFEKVFLKPEFTQTLWEGGCRFLQFGFESSTQRILDLTAKGNHIDEVDGMLENLEASGIGASVFWFIGFPTETEEEAYKTFDFIQDRRDRIALSSYTGTYDLLPDQPIFHEADRYGIKISRRDDGFYEYHYKDGSVPYDRTELNEAFLSRGDAEMIIHGAYLPYALRNPDGLKYITGSKRMGPLLRNVSDEEHIMVQRTPETHTLAIGRDPIKDFSLPPTPAKLTYHSTTGFYFRLLGKEMKVLEAIENPISISELQRKVGFEKNELDNILFKLNNRGFLKVLSGSVCYENSQVLATATVDI